MRTRLITLLQHKSKTLNSEIRSGEDVDFSHEFCSLAVKELSCCVLRSYMMRSCLPPLHTFHCDEDLTVVSSQGLRSTHPEEWTQLSIAEANSEVDPSLVESGEDAAATLMH